MSANSNPGVDSVVSLWETLARALMDGEVALFVAQQQLFEVGDRQRSANTARVASGLISTAWNLALAASLDESFAPIGVAVARACDASVRTCEAVIGQSRAKWRSAPGPSRKQEALTSVARESLALAATAARDLVRIRGGDESRIRDIDRIMADRAAATPEATTAA